jgi:hypothetical protein
MQLGVKKRVKMPRLTRNFWMIIINEKQKIYLRRQFIKRERYYMNINDVKEWMIIADTDFESAKILNESVRNDHLLLLILSWTPAGLRQAKIWRRKTAQRSRPDRVFS